MFELINLQEEISKQSIIFHGSDVVEKELLRQGLQCKDCEKHLLVDLSNYSSHYITMTFEATARCEYLSLVKAFRTMEETVLPFAVTYYGKVYDIQLKIILEGHPERVQSIVSQTVTNTLPCSEPFVLNRTTIEIDPCPVVLIPSFQLISYGVNINEIKNLSKRHLPNLNVSIAENYLSFCADDYLQLAYVLVSQGFIVKQASVVILLTSIFMFALY